MIVSPSHPTVGYQFYEQLRQEALECRGLRRGQGLVLFLRRGMAAWFHVLMALSPNAQPSANMPSLERPALPPSVQYDLTFILADMVFACHQEVAP